MYVTYDYISDLWLEYIKKIYHNTITIFFKNVYYVEISKLIVKKTSSILLIIFLNKKEFSKEKRFCKRYEKYIYLSKNQF